MIPPFLRKAIELEYWHFAFEFFRAWSRALV